MEESGVWNQRYDEIDDVVRARRLPSPQLVGTPERTTLDLNALATAGVELVGRLATVRDGRALFSGGLRNQFALADLKMERLLDTFDDWARTQSAGVDAGPVERFEPTRNAHVVAAQLDLGTGRFGRSSGATGVSTGLQLAQCPGGRSKGYLRHDGGVVEAPGIYPWDCRCCGPQVDVHLRRRGRRAHIVDHLPAISAGRGVLNRSVEPRRHHIGQRGSREENDLGGMTFSARGPLGPWPIVNVTFCLRAGSRRASA